jgi:hypothetical protein
MPGSELTCCRPASTVCSNRLGLPALLFVGVSALIGSTIAVAAAEDQADKPGTSPPARIAIVGATLINPAKSQVLENSIVTIEGNRIISVLQSPTNYVPPNTRVIDAHGKWLLPGYIDAHVHFFQSGGAWTINLPRIRVDGRGWADPDANSDCRHYKRRESICQKLEHWRERVTGAEKTYEGFAIYEVTDRAIRNVTLIPTD